MHDWLDCVWMLLNFGDFFIWKITLFIQFLLIDVDNDTANFSWCPDKGPYLDYDAACGLKFTRSYTVTWSSGIGLANDIDYSNSSFIVDCLFINIYIYSLSPEFHWWVFMIFFLNVVLCSLVVSFRLAKRSVALRNAWGVLEAEVHFKPLYVLYKVSLLHLFDYDWKDM